MRDIRGDLQDRASLLEEQINAAEAQFEKLFEQLKHEHETRLEDLKTELEAVNRLMELEHRRLVSMASAPEADHRRQPSMSATPEVDHRRQASMPQAPEPDHRRQASMPQAPEADHRRQASMPQAPEADHRRQASMPHAPDVDHRRQASMASTPDVDHRRQPIMPSASEGDRRRAASMPPAPEAEHRRAHMAAQPKPQPQPQAQPQQPLADFLMRKLTEVGPMSRDELCHFAMQEGYFVDDDVAERSVHATLVSVVKAGFARQLPNGNFAPATVMDTIRLRRAI